MTEAGKIRRVKTGSAWVAQLAKCWTPDLGSGHYLTVCEFKPHIGLNAESSEPAWDYVSPSFCPSPALSLSWSLSQNKNK